MYHHVHYACWTVQDYTKSDMEFCVSARALLAEDLFKIIEGFADSSILVCGIKVFDG